MRRAGIGRADVLAATVLAASFVAARLASSYIAAAFADRPAPRDLLFELLPYAAWPQYVTDVAVLAGAALVVWHLARTAPRRLPSAVTLFGLMELVRAALIMLTPLGGPLGNGAYYGLVRVVQNGEFPSGHAASAMLFFLLVDAREAPVLRRVLSGLVVVECVALLVSHGHYSIDIVGGLLLSMALHAVWARGHALDWIKRLVEVSVPRGPLAAERPPTPGPPPQGSR